MKRKIIGIFVCILVVIGSAFTFMASICVAEQRLVTQSNSSKQGGNTLIAEATRVIEVDSGGTIVWQKAGLDWPQDAERLENGNTLITEIYPKNRVIEVDGDGAIVWQKAGLFFPADAERLENGNTLITEMNRVIEVNSGGTIVWQKAGLNTPWDAERLENGNTLITETYIGDRVIEVDSGGTIVWQKAGLNEPMDAERISDDSPDAPIIDGPSKGQAGLKSCWTFHSEDPNNDQLKYIIDWGDGTFNMTDYFPDCTPVEVCHTYEKNGEYIIEATAEDETGLVSEESTLTVTIPKTRMSVNSLFQWFLERFLLLEKLLTFSE